MRKSALTAILLAAIAYLALPAVPAMAGGYGKGAAGPPLPQQAYRWCSRLRAANRHNPRNPYYFNQTVYERCQRIFSNAAGTGLTNSQLCGIWAAAEGFIGPEFAVGAAAYCIAKYP